MEVVSLLDPTSASDGAPDFELVDEEREPLMRPRNVVRLEPAAFQTELPCLGGQLVAIVQQIQEILPGLRWYVADVQTIGPSPVPRRAPTPVLVGDATAMIEAAQRVDQFESGVFAGVPSESAPPAFRAGGLWTEDEQAADLGDAAVEVRAFDTSYWSIATADPDLAQILRERIEHTRGRS